MIGEKASFSEEELEMYKKGVVTTVLKIDNNDIIYFFLKVDILGTTFSFKYERYLDDIILPNDFDISLGEEIDLANQYKINIYDGDNLLFTNNVPIEELLDRLLLHVYKKGYVIEGLYTNKSLTNPFDFDEVDDDIDLYIKFNEIINVKDFLENIANQNLLIKIMMILIILKMKIIYII